MSVAALSQDAPREMTGADIIARTFEAYGVTHVFFMESVLRKTLIAMEELGVKRVLTHSEAAAVYMADGYARISRRPGVCMAQAVGAANLAAAMQDPYLGHSPVIALTGKKGPHMQHRNPYQEVAHGPMFQPVTKYSVTVETLEQLPRLLRQALREAISGSPGPAHLDIAGGFAGENIEGAVTSTPINFDAGFNGIPPYRLPPDRDAVAKAARLLETAKRPIIVAGGGIRISSAGDELLALAEKLSIPVATSLNAKGIIREDHPLSVGVVGTYSRWSANRAVAGADLVLFIGSHTSDQVTNNWTVPGPETQVIQIDIDPTELGRSYGNTLPLCGDAKAALTLLADEVRPAQGETPWAAECRELVREWDRSNAAACASTARPIRPERLCAEIGKALPRDAVLVSDTGYAGIWSGALIDLVKPGQDYIRAAGSLGWGFPASLGAKCAAPERPVVCFTGDGGFWYHLSELETALRNGINTVTVINNNSGFAQCMDAINRNYGNRPGQRTDLYRFADTDFAKIANDLGCLGIRVTDPNEIAEALQFALKADRPVVIDVVTDLDARAPAPWTPAA